jgi:hypothetical protein
MLTAYRYQGARCQPIAYSKSVTDALPGSVTVICPLCITAYSARRAEGAQEPCIAGGLAGWGRGVFGPRLIAVGGVAVWLPVPSFSAVSIFICKHQYITFTMLCLTGTIAHGIKLTHDEQQAPIEREPLQTLRRKIAL